jgi:hypothetical protein
MAKKAKAKKAKKAKRAPARPAATIVTVPMKSVIQFVEMLIQRDRVAEFEQVARSAGATVDLDERSTEFVREFLASNRPRLRRAMMAAIDEPCPDDPFDC